MIEDSIEIIKKIVNEKNNDNPIKVYVFSNGQYPYTEDFEEVLPYITLCALPDAIYKAYQNVLPKKKKEIIPVLEDDILGEEENLFNQENE
jgi:adenine-specific DNA-methyltransferase